MAPPKRPWPRLLAQGRVLGHEDGTYTCVACQVVFHSFSVFRHAKKCGQPPVPEGDADGEVAADIEEGDEGEDNDPDEGT